MTNAWPASAVEMRPLDTLIPYARNSRTHSDAQVAQIAASMKEFGFTVPVLADETGGMIAGHGRILAATKLRDAGDSRFELVPTMIARGWSEAKKRAYVIADNKLALNAGWDMDVLINEIRDLAGDSYDLSILGFADDEIEAFLTGPDGEGITDGDDLTPDDAGESTTGTENNTLKFGGKQIPISADELDRLDDALSRYIEQHGVSFGFVSWMLDGGNAQS